MQYYCRLAILGFLFPSVSGCHFFSVFFYGKVEASEAVHGVCTTNPPGFDSISAPHQQQEPMYWVHCVALAWPLVIFKEYRSPVAR